MSSPYYIIVGLVTSLLFLNLYFRVKILKLYRYLVKNRVEFSPKHMLNNNLLEEEILPVYPQHKSQIQEFISKVKFSFTMASLIFILIVIFGLILRG